MEDPAASSTSFTIGNSLEARTCVLPNKAENLLGGSQVLAAELSLARILGRPLVGERALHLRAWLPPRPGVAAFLASDAGSFVTGQTLVVDGGTVITDGS